LAEGKPATKHKLPKRLAECIAMAPDGKAVVTAHPKVGCITPLGGQ
jgi:hypothetical protein